jgi:hypothetical protein
MENDTQINVADLALLRNLVEVASTRGAFKADELSTVGQVYDKLNTFLNRLVEEAEQAEKSAVDESKSTESGEPND